MAGVPQVLRIKNMKKENTTADKGTPRPSSGSSVSSRSSSQKTKEKPVDKGPTKEELIQANTELSREVENLTTENQLLKSTIGAVIDKLIENAKIKGVKVSRDVENPNVSEVSADSLVSLTEKLTAEKRKSDTMEFRVEELETRITHLNTELAKLIRTRVNVENELDELLTNCHTFEESKKKATEILRDVRSTKLFTFLDSLPLEDLGSGEVTPVQLPGTPLTSTPRNSSKPLPQTLTVILNTEKPEFDSAPSEDGW
ncbi:hypothetical protein DPMN_095901 [Dreissena polymorpha]|uniref:Uncharacterized protein n=1 Tax=Dreissena polymorpha TaxID=45954 RepID=A0A9D4R3B2_DREPO|nr:hypothetical protein DPMN_095901 [Dreissena polymorpha]